MKPQPIVRSRGAYWMSVEIGKRTYLYTDAHPDTITASLHLWKVSPWKALNLLKEGSRLAEVKTRPEPNARASRPCTYRIREIFPLPTHVSPLRTVYNLMFDKSRKNQPTYYTVKFGKAFAVNVLQP